MKNKKFYFELLIRKIKEQNLNFEVGQDFFIEMKYTIQNYLKKKCRHVGFLVIDLTLDRYCLWSRDYSKHALRYAFVFFWKKRLLLACFVFKNTVFIWVLESQWPMQVHGYKYLQDFRRPFSSCNKIKP